jgi:hypothetical protein
MTKHKASKELKYGSFVRYGVVTVSLFRERKINQGKRKNSMTLGENV